MKPWQFLLIATAIQIAATESASTYAEDNMKGLTDKLDGLQRQLDLTRETLKTLADHLIENTKSLQILERHHSESTRLPSSCVEVFERGQRRSGVYKIEFPDSYLGPFEVYCLEDPKGGLPWTVVQRRVDGSIDFNRDWADYKIGFGILYNNFFIGLDKLHMLTNQSEPQELWVKLTKDVTKNAYYTHFAIGNEAEKYALNTLDDYSGDAGNSLGYHKGNKFTTRDADEWPVRNCVKNFKGAWWYNGCGICNLNGVYGSTENDGIHWLHFRYDEVSMKYAHMAIRPARK